MENRTMRTGTGPSCVFIASGSVCASSASKASLEYLLLWLRLTSGSMVSGRMSKEKHSTKPLSHKSSGYMWIQRHQVKLRWGMEHAILRTSSSRLVNFTSSLGYARTVYLADHLIVESRSRQSMADLPVGRSYMDWHTCERNAICNPLHLRWRICRFSFMVTSSAWTARLHPCWSLLVAVINRMKSASRYDLLSIASVSPQILCLSIFPLSHFHSWAWAHVPLVITIICIQLQLASNSNVLVNGNATDNVNIN